MTPATLLIQRLKLALSTLGVAESCTGGLLSASLTDVPGASEVFRGGIVAYHNEVKQSILHVHQRTLDTFGAVSEQTAMEMVAGVRLALGVDYAAAITGVAGPGGGTPEKPVGLVYIAVHGPEVGAVIRNDFVGDRASIRAQSVEKALEMLLEITR